ncbi:MAG TPA: universal stress protein [Microbacteriaceae bacterium]
MRGRRDNHDRNNIGGRRGHRAQPGSPALEAEAKYARALAPGIVVHTRLLHGSLMRELAATSQSADLVVVGTHETGFVNGKVFGSRSLVLAATARAPVAIIPQTSPRDGRGVVVGVDDSAASRVAIRFAAREAERAQESLTLLHAYTVPDAPGRDEELQYELSQHIEVRTTTIVTDAGALAGETAPTVATKTRRDRRPASIAALCAIIGLARRLATL